ncbi:MAG: acetyl-CoA C-acyltransferase [Planctomycetes bacterium]|nr:acetyl-CoA C-acyltransferase [Planctomycetota bacterium]
MASTKNGSPRVVIAGGCRTPFLKSGTGFRDLMAYDLGRLAISGLLHGTGIEAAAIDEVVMGTVIQDMATSNLAREAALAAGIPKHVPAHTVTMACISANQAITTGAERIRAGLARVVVAGGAETCSDIPIRFRRPMRKRLIGAQKYKKPLDWLKFFRGFRLSHLLPEVPSISEFSTGLTMGQSCDRLTAFAGVSRKEQDEFALRSHLAAAKATAEGRLAQEIETAIVPPDFEPIEADNGFRGDTTMEKLAGLGPAFTRRFGTATAGNSSFLTDGASALLLADEERARELGLTPRARIRAWAYRGSDTLDELLLGPAFSIPVALREAGLTLKDIDVFEIHEAFAGAVLASLRCLESPELARKRLGLDAPLGAVDMEKVNRDGGSLSLGHPFGATGGRLVLACARRLASENGTFGLVTGCAAGGLGNAMVLERIGA